MQAEKADAREAPLADDMLDGADQIALFMYGCRTKRRRIYNLHETTDIPIFSAGRLLQVRKSKLLEWIEAKENRRGGA